MWDYFGEGLLGQPPEFRIVQRHKEEVFRQRYLAFLNGTYTITEEGHFKAAETDAEHKVPATEIIDNSAEAKTPHDITTSTNTPANEAAINSETTNDVVATNNSKAALGAHQDDKAAKETSEADATNSNAAISETETAKVDQTSDKAETESSEATN